MPVERAGDRQGPRSFEEAIREGTLAGLWRETRVPDGNVSSGLKVGLIPFFQPVSTWRGRAAPRSMGSIGVHTASSPHPGQ